MASQEPTRDNASGKIINTYITAERQPSNNNGIMSGMWKYMQGGLGRISTPIETVPDTPLSPPTRFEATTSRTRRGHVARIQADKEYTTRELARGVMSEWERVRPLLERVRSLVEQVLNTKEDTIKNTIETLKESEHDSGIVLVKMKPVVEGIHLSLQAIKPLLEESKNIIRSISRSITLLSDTISQSDDIFWVMKGAEVRGRVRNYLKIFENQIKVSSNQFHTLWRAFLEKYIRFMTTEIFHLRSMVAPIGPPVRKGSPSDGLSRPRRSFNKAIRHLSALAHRNAKPFKDVPGSYSIRHASFQRTRVEWTGMWLINDEGFRDWLFERERRILWFWGGPGTGKSVLVSRVIDSLDRSGMDYAYFYMGSGKAQSASGLVLALLEQLREPEAAENSTEPLPREPLPSLPTLLEKLRNSRNFIAYSASQLFIIIDAWDDDNMDSATEFQQVIDTLCSIQCKILLSSRTRPNETKNPTGCDIMEIWITRTAQAADVELYIQKMLQDKEPPLSNSDIESTTRSILAASGREFNLAKIISLVVFRSDPQTVIQRLNESPTQIPLLTSLEFLNLGYLSQLTILLLLALDRPLTLKTLQASLLILAKNTSSLDHNFDDSTVAGAIQSCELLVIVDPSNKVAHLNPEIRKYQSFMYTFWPDTACQLYLGLVKTGLQYFTGGAPAGGLWRTKSDIDRLLQENPFLEHSIMWPIYIHRLDCIDTDKLTEARQLADTLFDLPECLLYAKQLYFYLNEEFTPLTMTWDSFNMWAESINKLQLASRWGLAHIVEQLLAASPELVTENDTQLSTALHESAKRGFADIVKLLLERMAPTDVSDSNGKTPLDYAFERNHRGILAMLFESQARSDSHLQTRCIGDEVVFSYCQERSGIRDSQQRIRARELTMLRCISSDDQQQGKIAIFLLKRGTDPNSADEDGVPAMHLAAKHRQNDFLAALLGRDAEYSLLTKGSQKESALHIVARSGSVEAIDMLVNAGTDINCLDSKQRTPLFIALERSDQKEMLKMIKIMIFRGADVDRADNEGQRVLHIAAEKGLLTPLRLFHFFAKDRNPVDKKGKQPVDFAMRKGHEEVVQYLRKLALYDKLVLNGK